MKMSQTLNKLKQIASKFNHNKRKHKPGESTSSRPGWMVRDSHLTHGGLRMTNTTAGTFTGLILFIAFFCLPALFLATPTHADSITVSISGNPTITVAPTSEGTFADSGNITIGVTSTASSGYTLSIAGSNTSLTGTTDSTKSIVSIPANSSLSATDFNTSTYNNMWGYKPSKHYDSSTESVVDNSNYLPSPTSNGDIIDIVTTSASNDYTMSIGARVTNTIGFQSYENNTFVIAAVGNSKCNRAATTIGEAICMQDMNDNVINSMTMNQQYQLIDERDDKTYYIAKMKDGRVWMTQNLDLDLVSNTSAEGYVALTSDNTDLNIFNSQNYTTANGYSCSNASTTTNCAADGEKITWVPATTTLAKSAASSWSNDNYTPYSYDYEDYYYYTDTSSTNTAYSTESACTSAHNDGTCPHYHVGNYYNFTAAVASNSTSGITANRTVMGNSICPAGWKLPDGVTSSTSSNVGYYGEANYTWRAQGIINSYADYSSTASYNTNGYLNISNNPLYLARSGLKRGTNAPSFMGSSNFYQTNTICGSSNSYTSNFSTSFTYPGYYNGYRTEGYPVRCIAKQSNTGTTTITFNKNASDATGTTGTNNTQTMNANTLNNLTSNGFSRSGYAFNSWNTEADGSGTSYANVAQYYATTGTSTNNVTLYAQWDKTYAITFTYDSNVSNITVLNSGGSTVGTISTSGQSLSLVQNNTYTIKPTHASGYTTNTITKTSGAGTLSGKEFTVGAGVATISVTSRTSTTFDQAYAAAGKTKYNNYYKIQDMNSTICSNVDSADLGVIGQVIDTRDNEVYYVGKLADSKCWMLDNLRLDPANSTTLNNITESNTHASATTLNYFKNGGGTTSDKYPTAKINNVAWTSSSQNYYSIPMTINTYKDTTTTSYGAGSGKIGVYYNYCAASAGSYCYGDGTSAGTSSGNATEDLCPSGWRMPGGPTGEFKNLYNYYNTTQTATDINSLQYNLSLPLSGYFGSGSASSRGGYGYWWSSTRYGNSNMYTLRVNASNVQTALSVYRYNGYSLRCVTQ